MDSETDEVVLDLPTHFRVYKSGRVDRLHQPVFVPAVLANHVLHSPESSGHVVYRPSLQA
jgi:hypothetical protein